MKLTRPSSQAIKRANQSVYNAQSIESYEQNPSIFEVSRQSDIKDILSEISTKTAGERMLDVGCGTGNLVRLGQEHFSFVVGTDISPDLLGRVKQLKPELNLVGADADYLPFKPESFDCVTFYGTLHHFFDPARTLARTRYLIKPNGYLYTDHDPNYFFSRFYHIYYRLKYHRQPGFGSPEAEMAEFHQTQTSGINPEHLKKKLMKEGFREVIIHYRHTTNPELPFWNRLLLWCFRGLSRCIGLRSFYTHFYLLAKR